MAIGMKASEFCSTFANGNLKTYSYRIEIKPFKIVKYTLSVCSLGVSFDSAVNSFLLK
jgi:hypothetical protein